MSYTCPKCGRTYELIQYQAAKPHGLCCQMESAYATTNRVHRHLSEITYIFLTLILSVELYAIIRHERLLGYLKAKVEDIWRLLNEKHR